MVEIIAEIGENHGGSLQTAKQMIQEAAGAGADTVKFQSYNSNCLHSNDPEWEWFMRVKLSDDDHFALKKHAEKYNLKFLSSPFSIERANFLVHELGCEEIKVASAMFYNEKFIKHLHEDKAIKRVYLSTGMATLTEIHNVHRKLYRPFDFSFEVVVLHCVSLYPCPDEHLDMGMLGHLKALFGTVGYSDHSIGLDACCYAVASGVKVIEKHFTLDKEQEGTDHVLSVDPQELRVLVKEVQRIETMFGVSEVTEEKEAVKELLKMRFPN